MYIYIYIYTYIHIYVYTYISPRSVSQVDDMSSARLTLTPQLFWAGAALLHASRASLFLPAAHLMAPPKPQTLRPTPEG